MYFNSVLKWGGGLCDSLSVGAIGVHPLRSGAIDISLIRLTSITMNRSSESAGQRRALTYGSEAQVLLRDMRDLEQKGVKAAAR